MNMTTSSNQKLGAMNKMTTASNQLSTFTAESSELSKKFPAKLHDMMNFVDSKGLDDIISWELNGTAFSIHDPDKLVNLLPIFFQQTKYRSFRRQLNMWHFDRVKYGPKKFAFMHPFFVRGRQDLCRKMSRQWSMQPKAIQERKNQEPDSLGFLDRINLLSSLSDNSTKSMLKSSELPTAPTFIVPRTMAPPAPVSDASFSIFDSSAISQSLEPTPLKYSPKHQKNIVSQTNILSALQREVKNTCTQDESFSILCGLFLSNCNRIEKPTRNTFQEESSELFQPIPLHAPTMSLRDSQESRKPRQTSIGDFISDDEEVEVYDDLSAIFEKAEEFLLGAVDL